MALGKYFSVRSLMNGLCLDVQGGSCDVGTSVITYDYNGGENQLWYEDPISGVIRCKQNDQFVLDIIDGYLVTNYYEEGNLNQQWRPVEDRIENIHNPTQVLDIQGASSSSGASVISYEYNGQSNQQWAFDYTDADMMVIVSAMNGKVLDIEGGSAEVGAKLIMYDRNDGINQLWYEGEHGVIHSKLNDFVIDAGAYGDGEDCCMVPYDPGNENACFVRYGDRIENKFDHRVLDIKGRDGWDGANVIGYEFNGADNQQWSFEYI